MSASNDASKGGGPAADGTPDDRSTERRMAAAIVEGAQQVSVDSNDAEFAGHVARGTAFVREERLPEAKDELERAMAIDPCEPKLQDLLALVYFRLDLFANAIALYEQLRDQFPRDAALKVNLALAYLKTDVVDAARTELEEVVRLNPHHRRAWGYLGITYERLGAEELALRAFERGKLPDMTARIAKRGERLTVPAPAGEAEETPSEMAPAITSGHGFVELDAGELTPSLADAAARRVSERVSEPIFDPPPMPQSLRVAQRDASFHLSDIPLEIDEHADEQVNDHATVPPPQVALPTETPPAPRVAITRTLNTHDAPPSAALQASAPTAPAAARAPHARSRVYVFPEPRGVALDASGVALVRVVERAGDGFAARLESLRTYSATLRAIVLERQVKGRGTSEPFGGFGAPLVRFEGAGELVLAPRAAHSLMAIELEGERGAFREELVAGFELRLSYENIRVSLDESEQAPLVELRGGGAVVLEAPCPIRALEISPGRGVRARREIVAGWIGPVTPRPISAREAPAGQPGLALFEGDGLLFVCAR